MIPGEVGASNEWVRRRNTALVLRALRHGPASRAALSTTTGLAKATVGAIVMALEAGGAVAESELGAFESPGPGRAAIRGRPSRPVALRGERYVGLGLEVNVDYVAAVVLDLAGQVRSHETRPVSGSRPPLAVLFELAGDTVAALPAVQQILGSVVAVPGLVRADDRSVAFAPNLQVGEDQVASCVEQVLGAGRVQVANDADCAAYAEAHHGAAIDSRSLLYLTGTVGIGAGIVEAGSLVRGASGFAGEVGHMPVGDPDAVCGCGRLGCWEASVGLHAMLRAVAMPELETPLATAEAVAARARIDPAVRAALERVGHDVGLGLAVLSTVLDPAVVVLGGYFVPLADLVLEAARATLRDRSVTPGPGPDLRVGALGIEAAALGAAERALAGVFAGRHDLSALTSGDHPS